MIRTSLPPGLISSTGFVSNKPRVLQERLVRLHPRIHERACDAPRYICKLLAVCSNDVGSREHEILDELEPTPDKHVPRETTVGAFAPTSIDSLLRSLRVELLVLVGASTKMCVQTTAREAADRGNQVNLSEDGCAATSEDLHQVTPSNFQQLFGRVASAEQVMAELKGGA
jgi:isochorismate hydrolase